VETEKPIRETAPGRLEIRKGGGCLTLFGLPFLAAGIFVVLIGLGLIRMENAEEVPAWGWPVMVLVGALFVAAGGAMVFGRGATVIEKERGIVSEEWGLLIPMKRKETSLTEFSAVTIGFLPGDSDSAARYPVKLEPSGGGKELILVSPIDYADALRQARVVAAALRFTLKDRTSDHEVAVPPGELELPLRDRLGRQNGGDQAVRRPPAMTSELQESGGAVRISIPGRRRGLVALTQVGITTAVFLGAGFFVSGFFRETDTPEGVRWMFLGFFGLIVAASLMGGIVSFLRTRNQRTIVTGGKEAIVIEEQSGWTKRSTTLPAETILDIDYGTKGSALDAADASVKRMRSGQEKLAVFSPQGPRSPLVERLRFFARAKGVTVKSTSGLYTFGAGLPDEEIRYIQAVLRKALAG
jgi:hypothetical protein